MLNWRKVGLAWAPAIGYMALIWAISSIDVSNVPIEVVPLRDKGVHFLEYAVLGLLVAHASLATWGRHGVVRSLAVGVLITSSWGLLDELHQAFVPSRSSDLLDLTADVLGAILGGAVRYAIVMTFGTRVAAPAAEEPVLDAPPVPSLLPVPVVATESERPLRESRPPLR